MREPNPHLRDESSADFTPCQFCGESFHKETGAITLRGWTCGECLEKSEDEE